MNSVPLTRNPSTTQTVSSSQIATPAEPSAQPAASAERAAAAVETLSASGRGVRSNFAATASHQVPSGDLHDLPAQAVPSLLAQLPAAKSLAQAKQPGDSGPDIFAAACMEALRTSGQPGGKQAVDAYLNSFANGQLKAGVQDFVQKNASATDAQEIDPFGNFGPELLQQARASYANLPKEAPKAQDAGSTTSPKKEDDAAAAAKKKEAADKAAAAAQAKKEAAAKEADDAKKAADAKKNDAAGKAGGTNETDAAPNPTVEDVKNAVDMAVNAVKNGATAAPKFIVDKEAFAKLPKISGSWPAGHDYTYDVASVLKVKAPSHDKINTNPSAAQFTSYVFALRQAEDPKSGATDKLMAEYLKRRIDQTYPQPDKTKLSMSASMEQQIAVAEKAAGYTDRSKAATPEQLESIRKKMESNIRFTLANAGQVTLANSLPNGGSFLSPSDQALSGLSISTGLLQ